MFWSGPVRPGCESALVLIFQSGLAVNTIRFLASGPIWVWKCSVQFVPIVDFNHVVKIQSSSVARVCDSVWSNCCANFNDQMKAWPVASWQPAKWLAIQSVFCFCWPACCFFGCWIFLYGSVWLLFDALAFRRSSSSPIWLLLGKFPVLSGPVVDVAPVVAGLGCVSSTFVMARRSGASKPSFRGILE